MGDIILSGSSGSGGGGGGAVTIADGADVTLGSKADAKATDSSSSWTVVALLKGIFNSLLGTLTVGGTVTTTPPSHASTNVDQVGGAALTEGQKAMAASVPVVIASDQSAVPISGTVTTTPPSHASTNVDQIGGAAITEGQKAMAASVPVVIASDQSAVPVSGTVIANQGTPNTPANSWPVEVTDGTNILGTPSHPIRVDPTGTTTQPISAASLPLPANAAQETGGNLASARTDLDTLLLVTQNTIIQLLSDIRMELRIMNAQQQAAYGSKDELDTFRSDPYYASSGYDFGAN